MELHFATVTRCAGVVLPRSRRCLVRATAAPTNEPSERAVAECCYALLAAHATNAPADAVLEQYASTISAPDALTSLLVALGRKEVWATATLVARWARTRGLLLPSRCYVRISQRRAEAGRWDRALEALEWMREFGCSPSGESVEAVAQLAAMRELREADGRRLDALLLWLRSTDAGRALWHVFASPSGDQSHHEASEEAKPSWRSSGIALEKGGDLLRTAPLTELRSALAEAMSEKQ